MRLSQLCAVTLATCAACSSSKPGWDGPRRGPGGPTEALDASVQNTGEHDAGLDAGPHGKPSAQRDGGGDGVDATVGLRDGGATVGLRDGGTTDAGLLRDGGSLPRDGSLTAQDGGAFGRLDAGVCGVHPLRGDPRFHAVLIVLDASGSMSQTSGGSTTKWAQAVSAIEAVTAKLENAVPFGLLTFPYSKLLGDGGTPDCSGLSYFENLLCQQGALANPSNSCQPGVIDVAPAFSRAAIIAATLKTKQPSGNTPVAASLQVAHDQLRGLGDAGTAAGARVLLVTDGAPNCATSPDGGTGTDVALRQTLAVISAMAADGIQTEVLGFPADPTETQALDQMAQAGGTGATAHRAITDEAGLEAELQALAGSAASCPQIF